MVRVEGEKVEGMVEEAMAVEEMREERAAGWGLMERAAVGTEVEMVEEVRMAVVQEVERVEGMKEEAEKVMVGMVEETVATWSLIGGRC